MTGSGCGTVAGYQAHTDRGEQHCQRCKSAQADWQRHYRTRMYLAGGKLTMDATGVRRRIQALCRMGWSYEALAPYFGVSLSAVKAWTTTPKVRLSTAERVSAVYDQLWDKRGPSTLTMRRAETKGWPMPLAWDDETIDDPAATPATALRSVPVVDTAAVERACRGDKKVTLNRAEMAAAVARLESLGYSSRVIAERLGVAPRSVTRWRSKQVKRPQGRAA